MSAKDIMLRPVSAADARRVVEREHYSGKTTQNSQFHIGVFYGGSLEGALQFGPSIDKRKTAALVRDSGWHQFTELNRMAFSERLPRNSESRALGVAFRLLAKHAPQIKWVISFADATQCGDGTIYRASGFLLTGIKPNGQMLRMPDGTIIARKTLDDRHDASGRHMSAVAREAGAVPLPGYQFRYVRFLDPTWVDRLTVPVISFADIPDQARMYRGERTRGCSKENPGDQPGSGGASPTRPLHTSSGTGA